MSQTLEVICDSDSIVGALNPCKKILKLKNLHNSISVTLFLLPESCSDKPSSTAKILQIK